MQVGCLVTGVSGLASLAATDVDSWFRNGIGVAVGVLMAVLLLWTAWFGVGWAYLQVRGASLRIGFGPLPWTRTVVPLEALAAADSVDVDFFDFGARIVGGDPTTPPGMCVSTGGREAVRLETWDGRTFFVTLRRSEEVAHRLRGLIAEQT